MPINTITGTMGADTQAGTDSAEIIQGFGQGGGLASGASWGVLVGGFSQPVFVTAPPDDTTRIFVAEKEGQIEIVDLATNTRLGTPFLDLTGTLATASEQGLLGVAFDPDYARNRIFYVHVSNLDGDSEIRRYRADASDPNRAETGYDLILRVDQPAGRTNHKGGWIGFGPDGHLFISIGDGGGGGDPDNLAQNKDSLLGKMLRLDVRSGSDDFPADALKNYAIPADNPFAGAIAGADEIYALGLRNAWRSAFDRGSGDLFIADVGQGGFEEVNLGASGANYGWRLFEGNAVYNGNGATAGLTFPIHVYDHNAGDVSITGGTVYRGPIDGLHGQYVFGDYGSGRVFTLQDFDGNGSWSVTNYGTLGALGSISSFGEDAEGRLYAVDLFGGEVWYLNPSSTGETGADTLDGFGGNDRLYGGGGGDLARGGGGHDSVSGMAGHDVLAGGEGNDTVLGGDGNDTLFGEAGADHLIGAAGADELDGGDGDDTLSGGFGDDRLVVRELGDLLFETANGGQDSAFIFAQGYTLPGHVEIAYLRGGASILTGSFSDEQLVGNGASQLFGMGGNDVLWGSALGDTLDGGSGDDILRGQGGADSMVGGTGNDQFVLFNPGAVVVEASGGGFDTAWAAASGWTMSANIEFGRLTAGGTSLAGSSGADQLVANPGAASALQGGGGNDTLWGSSLSDTMEGGSGDDILYSYGGADRFVFSSPGWGFDQISGFNRADGARIVLTGLQTDYATVSANLTFGGGNTQINLGSDRVLVYGLGNLLESDFIF